MDGTEPSLVLDGSRRRELGVYFRLLGGLRRDDVDDASVGVTPPSHQIDSSCECPLESDR